MTQSKQQLKTQIDSDLLTVTQCACGSYWIDPRDAEAYEAVGDEVELCRIIAAQSKAIRVRSEVYA
jgi:hypothetical protein